MLKIATEPRHRQTNASITLAGRTADPLRPEALQQLATTAGICENLLLASRSLKVEVEARCQAKTRMFLLRAPPPGPPTDQTYAVEVPAWYWQTQRQSELSSHLCDTFSIATNDIRFAHRYS